MIYLCKQTRRLYFTMRFRRHVCVSARHTRIVCESTILPNPQRMLYDAESRYNIPMTGRALLSEQHQSRSYRPDHHSRRTLCQAYCTDDMEWDIWFPAIHLWNTAQIAIMRILKIENKADWAIYPSLTDCFRLLKYSMLYPGISIPTPKRVEATSSSGPGH